MGFSKDMVFLIKQVKNQKNFKLTSTRIFVSPENPVTDDCAPCSKFLNIATRSFATPRSRSSLSMSTVRLTYKLNSFIQSVG